MIKDALFKVCSTACYTFFLSFGQFMNNKPVKTSHICKCGCVCVYTHIHINSP